MSEWTEREMGICVISLFIGFCIGGLFGFYDENIDALKAIDEIWLEWS